MGHHFGIPVESRRRENRRAAEIIRKIDIGSGIKQHFYHVSRLIFRDSYKKRRPPFTVDCIHIRAFFNHLGDTRDIAVFRRFEQSLLTVHTAAIERQTQYHNDHYSSHNPPPPALKKPVVPGESTMKSRHCNDFLKSRKEYKKIPPAFPHMKRGALAPPPYESGRNILPAI